MPCSKTIKKMIEHVRQGFNAGLKPKLTEDGTCGTYEMRNSAKKRIAIFKAIDEEPFAPNNPRGHTAPFGSPTFRPGVLSGEQSIREVAAYLLDQEHFAGVPATTFVEAIHGSLRYVPFSAFEATNEETAQIISALILPTLEKQRLQLEKSNSKDTGSMSMRSPDSIASTMASKGDVSNHKQQKGAKGSITNNDTVTARLAQEQEIGTKLGSL